MCIKIVSAACMVFLPSAFVYGQEDPKMTEEWRSITSVATGKTYTDPPGDAVVLFNGNGLLQWQTAGDSGAIRWGATKRKFTVRKGAGDIQTKESFGSCQLHIEWCIPKDINGDGQARGNSGILFMGEYELQILDSYDNPTYSNGQAGSIYKQYSPLVNASAHSGKWQIFDVIFTAPRFGSDGVLVSPAKFTVFHNGVLIHNNAEAKGKTRYRGRPSYIAHADKKPLTLQAHDSPVSFRNVWIREL